MAGTVLSKDKIQKQQVGFSIDTGTRLKDENMISTVPGDISHS
jgi:hypothetical protein